MDGNLAESGTSPKMSPANIAVAEQFALEWVNNDKRRMLHVVYGVNDLEKTINYVDLFIPQFTLLLQG